MTALTGAVVPNQTRVHVPGMGDGIVVDVIPQQSFVFDKTLRLPAQILVRLDSGRRCARRYDELEAPA